MTLLPFITTLSLIISTSTACLQSCSTTHVPYPFGFSPDCLIPLNCTNSTTSSIDNFLVLSITSSYILVNLKPTCSRPIKSLARLFTPNFAPTSSNSLLLKNCSKQPTPCSLPFTALHTNFELYDCGGLSNNSSNSSDVSCYSENRTEAPFLNYPSVLDSKCQFLFSSIWVEAGNETDIELEVGVLRVGWWLDGGCKCVEEAECEEVLSPVTRQGGFRCKCREGFVGDGFIEGQGCARGQSV